MGQVWSGHDVDGHHLAFKLLRSEFAEDPEVVSRFLQERKLLLSIRSPYVIRVHDLVVEGPRLAIVLDFVDGPSLRDLLNQRGNLPPAQVAQLGAHMALGLAAVHQAGILHRDFKPENVLLAQTENGLTPKLLDFGIASIAAPGGHGGTANVIGTPQYLAPELGDARPASTSSDLYALGVSLYEMCCGIVPFSADSSLALLRLHADHAPGRPAGIPDALWELISHLMAKNPQDRPRDAAAIAAHLERLSHDFAGLAAPAPIRVSPATTPLTTSSTAASDWTFPAGQGPTPSGAHPVAPSAPVPPAPAEAAHLPREGHAPSNLIQTQHASQLPGPARPPRQNLGPLIAVAAVILAVLIVLAWLISTGQIL